nr:MAG TPA: hypothetical protein [Caudoviricetes sp.]
MYKSHIFRILRRRTAENIKSLVTRFYHVSFLQFNLRADIVQAINLPLH